MCVAAVHFIDRKSIKNMKYLLKIFDAYIKQWNGLKIVSFKFLLAFGMHRTTYTCNQNATTLSVNMKNECFIECQ